MTTEETKTRGEKVDADITALLRARNTLLWIVTREELRVERAIIKAAADATYETRTWDCAAGIAASDGTSVRVEPDPAAALKFIRDTKTRHVYIMRDLHKWVTEPVTQRTLRNLARELQTVQNRNESRTIIVLSPSSEIPPELAGHAIVIDYPLPDRTEIGRILDHTIKSLPEEHRAGAAPNGTRDAAIDAAVGLSSEEAANCYARSLVMGKKIDPVMVSAEKKRVIAREKVLTWYDPDPRGLEGVGGLDVLKDWLAKRKNAFSPRARAYGLQAPKGAMLVGVPGCGKSLTAKCIASGWQRPLLRLDMGALRGKFVGESEANIRKALAVAESVAPCILWVDEIEKALGGATGPQGDGGVSADALGALLSWMQEREAPVFVVATANDVSGLPPELLRKGRFDEVFFVDLPTAKERAEILRSALRARKIDPTTVNVDAIADVTEQFTGAELDAIVPDAMFAAFNDGERPVTTDDLMGVRAAVVPLAETAKEKISALRDWAKSRARSASTKEVKSTEGGRALDF